MTPLFQNNNSAGLRFFLLVMFSLVLMTADGRSHYLTDIRHYMTLTVSPLYYIVDTPIALIDDLSTTLVMRSKMTADNTRLLAENLQLKIKLHELQRLESENRDYRRILKAVPKLDNELEVARIMAVNLDPFQRQFKINKGADYQLEIGFPVLDEKGIVGQIIEVNAFSSRVMSIADPAHSIPVEILRSQFRTIAKGTSGDLLSVLYIHSHSEQLIRGGDMLIASGQGGIFPRGYPVANVIRVEPEIGLAYQHAQAKPLSRLSTNRQVLIARTGTKRTTKGIGNKRNITPR